MSPAPAPPALAAPTTATAEQQPKGASPKVVGVQDGDTITILHDERREQVRLQGIDSPEGKQAFGDQALAFTASLALGQLVTVRTQGVDRYGRTLAEVILPDGRSLNRELVRASYAWWFHRYSTDRTLEALETEARAARRGLWADWHPLPPWDWRERRRLEASPPVPAPPIESPAATPRAPGARPRQESACHPAYPDFCIPPPPPDLDCDDIDGTYFTVLTPDPHRFDGDRDGVGCER